MKITDIVEAMENPDIALMRFLAGPQNHTSMKPLRIISPTLLVHFSFNAGLIAQHGFQHGLPAHHLTDVTSEFPNSMKPGGYNFAYHAVNPPPKWVYGELSEAGMDAVLFRASGVVVMHEDDAERQVIFWGPTVNPARIMLLKRIEDRDLFVMNGFTGTYGACISRVR